MLIFRYKTLFGFLFVEILNYGTASLLRGGEDGAFSVAQGLNAITRR